MDYRCNNALGLWYIRKCRFDKAEEYLRRAVKVLMKRNPNHGEPIFNLGLALKYQYKMDEAYDMFYSQHGMPLGRMQALLLCRDFRDATSHGRCRGGD